LRRVSVHGFLATPHPRGEQAPVSDPACLRIPLAHYPGMNRFVLDWIEEKPEAIRFLRRGETPAVRRSVSSELVAALAASNRRWGLFVKEPLQQWATGNAVTLVAGQQVGFAGGPLYTLAKIASLVKMKRALETSGKPAVAFFWLATEDHDFDEVAQLSVPVSTVDGDGVNRQLDLLSIKATRSFESKSVVGRLPVPEALVTELLALYRLPRPAWLRDGVTFGDSFAELVATIFGSEVILVDALLPELRQAGAPLFDRIRTEWQPIQDALRTRSRELEAAGYAGQVQPRDDGDFTLLFEIDERGDRRIMTAPRPIPAERCSTSALTRPLLQDFVLRPDVFLGGPAEVAYYAQIAPLHGMFDVTLPRVGLRGHVLLAPKRVIKFAARHELQPEEMFGAADAVTAAREPDAVRAVQALAADAQRDLVDKIQQIGEIALPAEHSLARAITRSIGHIEYHFQKLTERAVKGIARKDRERWTAARELAATLHPDGHVQDRVVAWFPFWLRDDGHLIDRLIDEIEPDTNAFKVISL
ncbi:MAG TPA: bacillithiol biosynthesis BshC, partial [Thermoanaerobaculia bacterium]|nr:bacillithiol biosynthesis BshC [Thermoanaerobaculia bacterium]